MPVPPWPPSAADRSAQPGPAGTLRILERDEEAARRRSVVVVIDAAPRVHIDGAVRRHDHLPRMPDVVGEYSSAKSLWHRDAAIGLRAGLGSERRRGAVC